MRFLFVCALLLLFCAGRVDAACSGSSPNLTAASVAAVDVQACVNIAVSGDKINIPGGSATWDSSHVVTVASLKVTLSGATSCTPAPAGVPVVSCIDNTNITMSNTSVQPLQVTGASSTNFFRLTNVTVTMAAGSANGVIRIDGTQFSPAAYRIDHSHFICPAATSCLTFNAIVDVYGLFDHVFFDNADTTHIEHFIDFYGSLPGADVGYAAWNQPSTLGTANCNFVEDSLINGNINEESIDAYVGACLVVRYSTIGTGAFISTHGTDSGNYRSARLWEFYNLTVSNSTGTQKPLYVSRGGTGVLHDITFTGSTSPTNFVYQYFRVSNTSDIGNWQIGNGTTWFPSGNNLGAGNSGTINNSSPVVGTSLGFCTTNLDQWEPYNNSTGNNACAALHGGDTATAPFDQGVGGGSCYPCRDQPGRGHNQVLQPIYTWNIGSGITGAPDSGTAPIMTAGVDYINNGSTPKPGYTPYTYPHPLQGAPIPPAPCLPMCLVAVPSLLHRNSKGETQ